MLYPAELRARIAVGRYYGSQCATPVPGIGRRFNNCRALCF